MENTGHSESIYGNQNKIKLLILQKIFYNNLYGGKALNMSIAKKNLYYSQYNYQNEIHKMWTQAGSPAAAHRNFIAKLAKLLCISSYKLRCYFNGYKDNFKIKEK